MLNHGGSFPLEVIHNRLKIFLQGAFTYDKTLPELDDFLNKLIVEGKIESLGGSFQKMNNASHDDC